MRSTANHLSTPSQSEERIKTLQDHRLQNDIGPKNERGVFFGGKKTPLLFLARLTTDVGYESNKKSEIKNKSTFGTLTCLAILYTHWFGEVALS